MLTILERDWTQRESHRAGDHRKCDYSACVRAGMDVRPSPIYLQVQREHHFARIERENRRLAEGQRFDETLYRSQLWDLTVPQLRANPALKSTKGVRRLTKQQLIDTIVSLTTPYLD